MKMEVSRVPSLRQIINVIKNKELRGTVATFRKKSVPTMKDVVHEAGVGTVPGSLTAVSVRDDYH